MVKKKEYLVLQDYSLYVIMVVMQEINVDFLKYVIKLANIPWQLIDMATRVVIIALLRMRKIGNYNSWEAQQSLPKI